MTITRAAIVEAAIRVLDDRGLAGLGMRALAERLGIKAASLYWHVKDKGEVLELVAEHISERIALDGPEGGGPEAFIVNALINYRARLLEVRDAVQIFSQKPPATPARAALIATMLRNLEQLGVRPENLITTANLLNNYVLSFVADELRWQRALPGDTKELFGYPFDLDFDRQFRYGVDVLLSGITAAPRVD